MTHSGSIWCNSSSVLRFSSRSWSVLSSTISSKFLEYFSIMVSMLSNIFDFLQKTSSVTVHNIRSLGLIITKIISFRKNSFYNYVSNRSSTLSKWTLLVTYMPTCIGFSRRRMSLNSGLCNGSLNELELGSLWWILAPAVDNAVSHELGHVSEQR